MPLAAIIPVAADATIPLERPAPSPATKKLSILLSRLLFTIKRIEENLISGAYSSVESEATPGITSLSFSRPSIMMFWAVLEIMVMMSSGGILLVTRVEVFLSLPY